MQLREFLVVSGQSLATIKTQEPTQEVHSFQAVGDLATRWQVWMLALSEKLEAASQFGIAGGQVE
ncbi:hypothetical protein DYH09_31395 [bacterium CPR1]|nr:hypothetical protein [bacterium CPR1]